MISKPSNNPNYRTQEIIFNNGRPVIVYYQPRIRRKFPKTAKKTLYGQSLKFVSTPRMETSGHFEVENLDLLKWVRVKPLEAEKVPESLYNTFPYKKNQSLKM